VREQDQRQRGREICSLHAPEVGGIGRARHTGVATPLKHSKGGQFVAQFKGNPYGRRPHACDRDRGDEADRVTFNRILAMPDAGYRGHDAPPDIASRSKYRGPEAAHGQTDPTAVARAALKDDHRVDPVASPDNAVLAPVLWKRPAGRANAQAMSIPGPNPFWKTAIGT
jgi:hypothetical protein